MSWWGSHVSSLFGDKVDSLGDWFTGASSANRQYRYQSSLDAATRAFEAKEAEKAYERQKDFFAYQANYNTPKAQMQRLREANLNPNLVYGNGAMAVQSSTGVAAQGHAGSPGSASGGISNAGSAAALLGLLSGGLKDFADAKLANERARGQKIDNQFKTLDHAFGDSIVGRAAKGLLGAGMVFPEQFDYLKQKGSQLWDRFRSWANDPYNPFEFRSREQRDNYRALFGDPGGKSDRGKSVQVIGITPRGK